MLIILELAEFINVHAQIKSANLKTRTKGLKFGQKIANTNKYKSIRIDGINFSIKKNGKFNDNCVSYKEGNIVKCGLIEEIFEDYINIKKFCFIHTPYRIEDLTSNIGIYSLSSSFISKNPMDLNKAFLIKYEHDSKTAIISKFDSNHLFK